MQIRNEGSGIFREFGEANQAVLYRVNECGGDWWVVDRKYDTKKFILFSEWEVVWRGFVIDLQVVLYIVTKVLTAPKKALKIRGEIIKVTESLQSIDELENNFIRLEFGIREKWRWVFSDRIGGWWLKD